MTPLLPLQRSRKSLALATLFTALQVPAATPPLEATAAINQFGIELYQQLTTEPRSTNLIISPYSIGTALAMARAGSAGQTRDELTKALHLPSGETETVAYLTSLRTALSASVQKTSDFTAELNKSHQLFDPIELNIGNRLFGQAGYDFNSSFLSSVRTGYDASLDVLDFKTAPEPSRARINDWIEVQTKHKIRDLIPRGGVDASTRLILVNALYLKAPWDLPFSESETKVRPFYPAHSKPAPIPTMHATREWVSYFHSEDCTTIALPCTLGEFQFVVVIPDQGIPLAAVTEKLTPNLLLRWTRLQADKQFADVSLYLPKFRLPGNTIALQAPLRRLGINTAFDFSGAADFSPISRGRTTDHLALSDVVHQTFLSIGEKGLEAAAAFANEMITGAHVAPPAPIEVHVDHPFFFAVQHIPSGVCFFLGHIGDPH